MSTPSGFQTGINREVYTEAVLYDPEDPDFGYPHPDPLRPVDVCIDPESPIPEAWKLPSGGEYDKDLREGLWQYGELDPDLGIDSLFLKDLEEKDGKYWENEFRVEAYGQSKAIIPESDELRSRDRETQDGDTSHARFQQSSPIHRVFAHSKGDMSEVPSSSAKLPTRLSSPRGHSLPPTSPHATANRAILSPKRALLSSLYYTSDAEGLWGSQLDGGPGSTQSAPVSMSQPNMGGFQCNYPSCTAQPFQSQYLLNSHANVHNSERPHYCPVKGCPRSEGGKGFKRKNDMMRHGLVHDCPCYICPFCPDREHKYPRPDNLQRHVRVHHADKEMSDPLLHEVLSQLPRGPSRTPRRRNPSANALDNKLTEQAGDQEVVHRMGNAFTKEAPKAKFEQNGLKKGFSDDSIAILTTIYHGDKDPLSEGWDINAAINTTESSTEVHTGTVTTIDQNALSNTNESYLPLSDSSDPGNPEVHVGITDPQISYVPYPQTIATDSGYASLGNGQCNQHEKEDDAQTVFTDNQELDVLEDVKEKLSTAFAGELLQNIRGGLSACCIERPIRNALAEILKEFSIRCRRTATSKQQNDATTFIRHYRHCIAKLIEPSIKEHSGIREEQLDEEEEDDANVKAQDGLSLVEKMQLWQANRPEIPKPDDRITNAIPKGEDIGEIEDYAISQYSEAWNFITNGHGFRWLIGRIKTEMVLTERRETTAENIRLEILRGLGSSRRSDKTRGNGCGLSTALFEIHWSLPAFLEDHYPNEQNLKLASIIAIVESNEDAQSMTCGEYMRQVWPATGAETLNALQEAIESGMSNSYECTTTENTRISLAIAASKVVAVVSGTEPSIAEIGQQLAWLGAALRDSPFHLGMAYSTPKITTGTRQYLRFTFSFHIAKVDSFQGGARPNGACWHPLFRNPIIVKGYPILARVNGEKGLEIPLNIMAGLGEASRVTNFDGGLLIKGFSTMFCPTQRMQNSLLWHFLYNDDGSRISYLSADSISGGRLSIQHADTAFMEHSRHFLGWASSVELHAGTRNIGYENIDWAGSSLASAGLAIQNASIVAGKFLTGGISFVRGIQDTPIYISRGEGPYNQEIHFAHNMRVVLYDVRDRRGWLIDGASALLHITRTQLASRPYAQSKLFRLEDFHHADPSDGIYAAETALMDSKNRDMAIFEDVETSTESRANIGEGAEEQVKKVSKRWTYQDLVRQTYHTLEQIHDYQTKMMASPTLGIRCTPREKLLGFGFMDIVDGQNDLLPRVATLKPSGRGWVDFTRTIRAITLLGKGFGEIIKPSKDSNKLCKYWNHVPLGKDYLVACTATLKDIARKYGDCDSDPLELADGIYWHKPDKLFEPCECKHASKKGACDRVQVLLPPSLGSKKHPYPFDCRDGAVIFGRSKRFPWRWPSKGEPVKGGMSDSESDDESVFHDSGIGSQPSASNPSSNPTSDIDKTGSLDSSPSNRSPLSSIAEGAMMSGGLGDVEEFQIAVDPPTLKKESQAPTLRSTMQSEGNTIDFGEFEMLPLTPQPSLQVPTRPGGAKRTWDKFKEKAPEIFPMKKQKVMTGTTNVEDIISGGGLDEGKM